MKLQDRLILIRLKNKLIYKITDYKQLKIRILKWIHK